MSYRFKDSRTGKVGKRKSPLVTFRCSENLESEIEEMMLLSGMSRSEVVSRCILFGLDEVRKAHGLKVV